MTRTPVRLLLAAIGGAAAVLLAAGPAVAHVSVNPDSATQGGHTRVAFRVPNESDTASTTKVEVFMPTDHPIAAVSTMRVPGWTAVVERGKPAVPVEAFGSPVTEVVTKVTWTAAADAAVKPGEFAEFPLSLGPLPAADRLVFKALQTYSDGNVSRWIEEPAAGGEEPENPAPVLTLAKADAAAPAPTGVSVEASAGDATGDDAGSGTPLALGVAGLVAGLAGLALGALAFARTRRTA